MRNESVLGRSRIRHGLVTGWRLDKVNYAANGLRGHGHIAAALIRFVVGHGGDVGHNDRAIRPLTKEPADGPADNGLRLEVFGEILPGG